MAALGLGAMDVVTAIAQQNIQVADGQIGQQPVPKGQQFQLTINTQGRLTDPDEFSDIILKAGQNNTQTQTGGSSDSGDSSGTSTQNGGAAVMNSQGGS